jgi:ATP-dependent Clp protease ATP-binding subunit ClpX
MDPLDRDSSCDDSTKNALIKQYQKIVFYGWGWIFNHWWRALDFIVGKALEYKLESSWLRSLCEAVLTDAMYELPSSDVKKIRNWWSLCKWSFK